MRHRLVAATLLVLASCSEKVPVTQVTPAVQERMARKKMRKIERHDKPMEAMRHFLAKRLPGGMTELPVDRYAGAAEHVRAMARYDTATRSVLPSERALGKGLEKDALGNWTFLGPSTVGGRTRAVVIHPAEPDIMYAGGVTGGIWKTTNGGTSWTGIGDLLPNIAVASLVMDPRDPNTLYAGTGEIFAGEFRGVGVYKTTDAGANWQLLSSTIDNPNFTFVTKLAVSPIDSRRVYAATATGVMRSLDGGASWNRVLESTRTFGCTDLIMRADQTRDYAFAACGIRSPAGVFLNTDAGGSGQWTEVLTDPQMGRASLAFAPSQPTTVYALAACGNRSTCGDFLDGLLAVYRSTQAGAGGSWTRRVDNRAANPFNRHQLSNVTSSVCFEGENSLSNQGSYDNVIAVDPANPDIVWAGGIDLWRSNDGGANWGLASYWWADQPSFAPQYAHADHHVIVFHPRYNGTSNQIMYTGNDGGIQRTDNARAGVNTTNPCNRAGQVTYTRLNNGLAITQFYNGAASSDGALYLGGTQDNGTNSGNDGTGPLGWREILGGDGGYVAIDPGNPNIQYAEFTDLSIHKSTDGGRTFSKVTSGITETPDNFLFIAPFTMDPGNPQRLYIGGRSLWRTDNAAAFWTAASRSINSTSGRGSISAIAVASTNSNKVLVGTDEGFVHRLDNAASSNSATNFAITSKPRDGYLSWLAFDPTNDNIAYATVATFNFGANRGHVFRSTNGGATWTSIDGSGASGIPDVPAHTIVADPNSPRRLFLGTDVGVFASEDGGATWLKENAGFANVMTETLTVNPGSPKSLFAFTHGRGVWRVPLGSAECSYGINGSPGSFQAQGGTGSIAVTTGAGCAWEAAPDVPWITITRGAAGEGPGNVAFNVAANTTQAARTGRITIADRVFTITQGAIECRYTVAPLAFTATANGGAGTVRVTAPAGCTWSAVSNISWLTVTAGATGTGDGNVNFTAALNPVTAARTGTLTIAEQTVTVNQAGRAVGAGGAFDESATAPRIERFPFGDRFDTSGATANASDPVHSCTGQRDSNTVWFRFTPTFTGPLQVTTVGSGYDTVLAIYDNNGQQIGCNDDISRTVFQSNLTQQVSAFNNYVIQVAGYGPSNPGGTLVLTVSANDHIASATPIAALPFTFTQDTRFATIVEADREHSCTNQRDSKSVWFRIQPQVAGRLMVDTVGSSYDTVLAAYEGTVPQRDIACGDDIDFERGIYLSAINFPVTANTTYLIQVTHYGANGTGGTLVINFANNDTPASATLISSLPFDTVQGVGAATATTDEPAQSCSDRPSSKRVWFRYQARATGRLRASTEGSSYDTVLTAHQVAGTAAGPAIACNDDAAEDDVTSSAGFPVTAGQSYFIQVGAYGQTNIGGRLQLSVREDSGCGYTLSPGDATVPNTGGGGTFQISAGTGCSWTAASDSTWLTIQGARSGSGNGSVAWVAAANSSGDPRSGAINIGGRQFIVTQDSSRGGLADLTVASITAPFSAVAGTRPNYSTLIVNTGTVNAGSFSVAFYLSPDVERSGDDVKLENSCAARDPLPPGFGVRCSAVLFLPEDLPLGDYHLIVSVDEENAVEELDESNNVRASAQPITITGSTSSAKWRGPRDESGVRAVSGERVETGPVSRRPVPRRRK